MKGLWCFVAGLLLVIAQSSWQSPLQDTEEKARQQGLEDREKENFLDQLASNGLARRHAEYERHADGTYTSDISSYLEGQAAKEFIACSSEGVHTGEDLGRRHADGTFTSDYNKLLDDIATQEFLKWLINQKVTQRDLQGEYQ
ncbi:pro-glucagon isoform X3 [Ahaetulla prasina]|uniref:pro-glucagon isoform X3 n=1 Tax=Ahaetulla prasina TaxID=499056 RepID=UPI0026498BA9|nr:pro-glucagon isoform X3 [Ahaetulla prasina]